VRPPGAPTTQGLRRPNCGASRQTECVSRLFN
jgi:hypothetical protein